VREFYTFLWAWGRQTRTKWKAFFPECDCILVSPPAAACSCSGRESRAIAIPVLYGVGPARAGSPLHFWGEKSHPRFYVVVSNRGLHATAGGDQGGGGDQGADGGDRGAGRGLPAVTFHCVAANLRQLFFCSMHSQNRTEQNRQVQDLAAVRHRGKQPRNGPEWEITKGPGHIFIMASCMISPFVVVAIAPVRNRDDRVVRVRGLGDAGRRQGRGLPRPGG